MKWSTRNTVGIPMIMLFSIFLAISFVIYPEIGEKILYGKHPPEANSKPLEYSDIILSENYDCMESSSIIAKGELSKFVKEFNDCNR